jgi:mono/diheme cytochrome c family protein
MKRSKGLILLVFLAGAAVMGTHMISVRFTTGMDPPAGGNREFLLPREREAHLSREQKKGKVLYEYYCALCHGKTGNADGFNAYNLKTPPTRHTDPILMGTLSDTQIQEIIRRGGAALGRSPQMPQWKNILTEREIAYITSYIRILAAPEPSRTEVGAEEDGGGKETGSQGK